MFYDEKTDTALRFGDVVRGYISSNPNIQEPFSASLNMDFKIDVNIPLFSVVLTPCCSIGEKMISLTPLIQVRAAFFDNPYLEDDLTRINRMMDPTQTVSPYVWDGLPGEEQQRRLEEGKAYAFLDLFIYERNDLLPKYTLHRRERGDIETNYYMIDFRNTCKLNCEKIITPKDAPLDSKCLQLLIQTRAELRDKIAFYYGRTPEEDKILLED